MLLSHPNDGSEVNNQMRQYLTLQSKAERTSCTFGCGQKGGGGVAASEETLNPPSKVSVPEGMRQRTKTEMHFSTSMSV